jgi:hypothetical protein
VGFIACLDSVIPDCKLLADLIIIIVRESFWHSKQHWPVIERYPRISLPRRGSVAYLGLKVWWDYGEMGRAAIPLLMHCFVVLMA